MMTMLRDTANGALSTVLEMIDGSKKVLDIGCATGDLARALTARNCDVVGIDVNPRALDVAGAFCTSVILADLDVEPLAQIVSRQTFDTIVIAAVLEHLRAPLALLEQTRAHVNDGGSVIATVPSFARGALRLALLDGRVDYEDRGNLDDSPLPVFSPETIGKLFDLAGFRIDRIVRTALPTTVPETERPAFGFVVKARPLSDAERYEAIADRLHEAHAELVLARTQNDSHLQEIEALRQVLHARGQELDETRAHLINAEREMRAAQGDYRQAAGEREHQRRDSHDARMELAGLRNDLETLRREAAALRIEADDVTERFVQHVAVRTARTRARANALEQRLGSVQRGWSWRLKRFIRRQT